MRPLRLVAILLWVAVFVLGGWYAANVWFKDRTPAPVVTTAADGTTDSEAATTPAPTVLPDFTLTDLKGQPRSSSEWKGRTVLFNFWATWCAPCRREMPLLEQFASSQGENGVVVVGVAIDRLEPVLRFVGETGVTYPVLVGQMDATRVAESFGEGFAALPFSVVAAPDGTLLSIYTGELHTPDLAQIAELAGRLQRGELAPADARDVLKLGSKDEAPAADDSAT